MWFDSNNIVDYTVVDTPPHNKAVFQKKVVLKNMPCRNSFVIKLLAMISLLLILTSVMILYKIYFRSSLTDTT